MPQKTNCSLVHSGREPGPCKICGTHDHTKRHVHMCQKKDRLPAYYKYVVEHHTIEDDDCICRKCDAKLTRDSRLLRDDVRPPAKRRSLESSDSASNAPDLSGSISGSCSSDCASSALHYWVPGSLNTGRMVYREGTDFMRCAHSQLNGHKTSIDEPQAVNKALQKKLDDLSESLQAMKKTECLDETFLKNHQNVCFDVHEEIQKLDPVLWNFIYRLTANEIEEKEYRRDVFYSWENSYLGMDDSYLRLFPRLFIASCIFNAQSSKCGHPLHLLLSDVLDKYSGSSTELLAISNRLGATVSKESLKRLISSRCIQLDKEPNLLSSDSFTVASFDNLDKNQKEKVAWDKHVSDLSAYCFSKSVLETNHIVVPGLKAYLAYDCSQTEVSEFHSIAVFDETDESKATIELTLNILYDKFQVGTKINYLVVVGDGKSYDILIKLKSEYGNTLDWVLPYLGDWHILKNLLPVFIKIYYDAGLKDLAVKFHHGATLKVLTECTRFPMTHRFLSYVWKAMFRYQVETFMRSHRSPGVACFDNDFKEIISVILESADITVSRDCNGNLEGDIQDFKVWSSLFEQKDRFSMMFQGVQVEFNEWMALDEAHEMKINLKPKKAMTYYLPYRAETLHNLKVKLDIESVSQVTVYKQKKEIKDNKTVISCLRKQIAFSKLSSEPVTDLDQSRYPDAFLSALPTETGLTAVILEGMFMINSNPAPQFIFDRWIVRSYKQFSASEIHVVFDHPNRHGCSPKDVERSRRDSSVQATDSAVLSSVVDKGLLLPASWRLVASVYFAKHRTAFRPSASISEFYNTIELCDGLESHTALVKVIREHMWERKQSEDNMLPNSDALQLHWDRSCWVAKYWKQALDNSMYVEPIDKYGWIITNTIVSVVWDSDVNIDKVEKTIKCWQNELPELYDELECFSDVELDTCSDIDSDSNSDEGEDEVQIALSHSSEEFQQYWDTF
ncbi:KRAB [Mytilus coruscus]|uniref:KRAB n=1 Tax=Mytilus coruscus TaxID=42192 RepID=A0A6J8DPH6_MYTCO|nr:KRAB [Mytilus coruscus]